MGGGVVHAGWVVSAVVPPVKQKFEGELEPHRNAVVRPQCERKEVKICYHEGLQK